MNEPHNLSTASQKVPTSTGMEFTRICLKVSRKRINRRIPNFGYDAHLRYRVPRINEWGGPPCKNRTKSLTIKCFSPLSPGRVRRSGHSPSPHIRVRGTYTSARSKSKSYAIVQTDMNSGINVSMYWIRGSGVLNESLLHACHTHSLRTLSPSIDSGVFPRLSVAIDPSFGSGGCKME